MCRLIRAADKRIVFVHAATAMLVEVTAPGAPWAGNHVVMGTTGFDGRRQCDGGENTRARMPPATLGPWWAPRSAEYTD